MEYKIGQMFELNQDIEIETALLNEKRTVKKGTKIIIGADNLAHHIGSGMIQPLGDATVKGYDTVGLAEYLTRWLNKHFYLEQMLEDYDDTLERFTEEIAYALDEIGF